MTDEQILAMLKIDIGFKSSGNTAIDDRLLQIIKASERAAACQG